MNKLEFFRFFEKKLQIKVKEFCHKINNSNADLYILMARKAACLVTVLEELSLITLEGKVISERLLDTNINWKGIRKIIIIDDVIISGTTLNRTINKLLSINKNFEIQVIVIGIDEKWFQKELLTDENKVSYIKYPIKEIENSQCIKLSGDIVRMLSIYPLSYNIDFPIYQSIKLNHKDFEFIFRLPGWEINDTTSFIQNKYDVFTYTFIPTEEQVESCGALFNNGILKDSLLKIRIYGEKKTKKKETFSFSLVPITILPPLKEEQIDKLFEHLAEKKVKDLSRILYTSTSKLRFIQFVIADKIATSFIKSIDQITQKKISLLRKYSSLRLLFPEEIIGDILDIADKINFEIDVQYNRQEIPVKAIDSNYQLNDFISINNSLNKPFLDFYYDYELKARRLAFEFGKEVFSIYEYRQYINRLNQGYSLLDLENILKELPKDVRVRILSTYLDRSIDNGTIVPITVKENDIVYRAFRHGEDVQFGQREEKLCQEMLITFAKKIGRKDFQKIWIEKLLVFFLRIGERRFLEPIQTEINNYQYINGSEKNLSTVASVKYFLQGPVVLRKVTEFGNKYDFNPCVDYSDKAFWLSRYFQNENKLLTKSSKGLPQLNNEIVINTTVEKDKNKEIVIDKESIREANRIGTIFGTLINNHEISQKPSIDSDELVALSACCEPKEIIGALAAEINIVSKIWNNQTTIHGDKDQINLRDRLRTSFHNNKGLRGTAKYLRKSLIFLAINNGQKKFDWYITKTPKLIIDRISVEFHDDLYRDAWDSFWSPNLDWSEESEDSQILDLAKKEGIWLLCANIYLRVLEYCLLYKISSIEKDLKPICLEIELYYNKVKNFASHTKTGKIIPFVNNFLEKKSEREFIEDIFDQTFDKVDSLVFSTKSMIEEAEAFYANFQKYPEIKYFTSSLYIETELSELLKIIENVFSSICYRINKIADENNLLKLEELPKYDSILGSNNGRWFIGNGKDADKWLIQFAIELINKFGLKFNYKLFFFPNIPSECAVKIINETKIRYGHFWYYIANFYDYIKRSPFYNGIIHTVREDTYAKSILDELKLGDSFYLQQMDSSSIRLPNLRNFNICRYINKGKTIMKRNANVGILTIVTEEQQAVIKELNIDINKGIQIENREFYEGQIDLNGSLKKKIVVLQSIQPGNIPIVSAYQSMVRNYDLDYVVLLGIAGSLQKKLTLCDVVIGTSVIYYEKKKVTGKQLVERRGEFFQASFNLTQLLNKFFVKFSEPAIFSSSEDSYEILFKTDRGPIGSGEAVIADPLSEIKKWLIDTHSKTAIVETEAAGFCSAFYETNNTKDLSVKDIIIIRGISDHADFAKDDKWRLPASRNAVIVLKNLLTLMYK